MAEPLTQFVSRRRPAWTELSALLDRALRERLSLEQIREVDRLYREASSDLARAQAFYAGADVEHFLHELCGRAYIRLYQPPRRRWERLQRFYARELPQLLRAEALFVWIAAALFLLGCVVGALLIAVDPHGAELLVAPELRERIARREMWTDSILSVMPPNALASAIATNNLSVTIAAFGSGVLLGLGPLYILVSNGLHLGSVLALCAQHEMADKLLDFVAAHGPVELSIIVIAGAAGLMVGQALLVPGELTRADALRERGRAAVRLVVGCAPFLATIAVVEGFVSPGHLFPTAVKAAVGVASGGAFWGYLLLAGRSSPAATAEPTSSEARLSR